MVYTCGGERRNRPVQGCNVLVLKGCVSQAVKHLDKEEG